jgi:phosphopantothenoylcysteine decarboxylase/phosphopantothenate--cysteine ligase
VSDFSFGKVWQRSPAGDLSELKSGKLSTRHGTLMAELVPTQKIIAHLRDWFPQACLVGWKYEVDGAKDGAIASAKAQLAECRTDACVANGPAYSEGFGLIKRAGELVHCPDMAALFTALERATAPA